MPGPPGPQGAAVSDPSVEWGGEICLSEDCSAMPLKSHANKPVCKHVLSLRPRRGSIWSLPQYNKARTQTGETSVKLPVKLGMFCFLGSHPG